MKHKRIFIIRDTLTSGKVLVRLAFLKGDGSAHVPGERNQRVTLSPEDFRTTMSDALRVLKQRRADAIQALEDERRRLLGLDFTQTTGD